MTARKKAPATSPLEWMAAMLGALIALALLGTIGWEALTGSGGGPVDIELRLERVMAVQGGYVAEVTVRNLSDRTVAALEIEGAARESTAEAETSQVTLDYLPGQARRRAVLQFRDNPAGRLELRVRGYREP